MGGGLGGSGPKTHWGMCLLDKIMILQGVKLTIQPLGVGYAHRPKNAQNGGVCGIFPYIRLPGFDLTTSARGFYCLRQCTSTRGCQSANQSLSQASSQSDRNTQFGFLVSGRRGPKQWGDLSPQTMQWPNGNAADRSLFGRRFEPRSAEYGAAAAAANSWPTRIRTADRKLCAGYVTIQPAVM